jgi:hypothetical protein
MISRTRLLRANFKPSNILMRLRKTIPIPFKLRLALDRFRRPEYAYCTFYAAQQAKHLDINRISAIEFGVAGGTSLVDLEEISELVAKETSVEINIYGFDLGTGLPSPLDYRDLPYVFQKGFYKMDFDALTKRLKKAALIMGDIKNTVQNFFQKYQPAPIGFVGIDLDYYSSTVHALRLLNTDDQNLLPRVFCYFDDLIGNDYEIHSEFAGELLAIREFNDQSEYRKLAKVNGLHYKRIIKRKWCEQVYVLHSFKHPLYSKYVYKDKDRQLVLK